MGTEASANAYEQKKQVLLAQWKARMANSDQIGLQKETTNLFRHRKVVNHTVDVRDFNRVIAIDKENGLAEVEGMTTYEDLVAETLKHDLLPTVVPELKSITIGGAVSGIGIESSSFRYGLVHETITEMEILLADGNVVTATPTNDYADLFFAFPNSYGTLGYTLKLKVKLIEAKRYVKLTHRVFTDAKAYFAALNEVCVQHRREGVFAYVDGAVFSKEKMVLTTGEFVDEAPYVSDYTFMKIYYRSLLERSEDYLSAKDYIWRWDTDWFWCSKVFGVQNPMVRALVGRKRLNSKVYRKMMNMAHRHPVFSKIVAAFSKPAESVIQDVCIPIENAEEFFDFFTNEIGITPFWTCPIRSYDDQRQYSLFQMRPGHLYVNFGFWDSVPSTHEEGFYNRKVEAKVTALGGNKSLYSTVYYTKEAFWDIYSQADYDALKHKYDPHARLRGLYEKCTEKS